MKLRLLVASLALLFGITGGLALESDAHAAVYEFYCGNFAQSSPTVTAYGIQGSAYCTLTGTTYYLEGTCIAYSPNSWGYPLYTDPGSGPRNSCDALDTPYQEIANGYVQSGCFYYWTETTYFYAGGNHQVLDNYSLYKCH